MIDEKTKELMRQAQWKKDCNRRNQKQLYKKGKKQGGKYTHDINKKGNTVCATTHRNASPQYKKELEEAQRKRLRKLQENLEKSKRKKILERLKKYRLSKLKNS